MHGWMVSRQGLVKKIDTTQLKATSDDRKRNKIPQTTFLTRPSLKWCSWGFYFDTWLNPVWCSCVVNGVKWTAFMVVSFPSLYTWNMMLLYIFVYISLNVALWKYLETLSATSTKRLFKGTVWHQIHVLDESRQAAITVVKNSPVWSICIVAIVTSTLIHVWHRLKLQLTCQLI